MLFPPAGTINLRVMLAGGKSWPKIVQAVHSADVLRIVTQLCIKTECSSVKKKKSCKLMHLNP